MRLNRQVCSCHKPGYTSCRPSYVHGGDFHTELWDKYLKRSSYRSHALMLKTKLIITYFHRRSHWETRLTKTVWLPAQGRSWDRSWKDGIRTFLAQRVNVDEEQTNMSINRCFPWKKDFIRYKLIWNSAECLAQWSNIQGWRWGVN